MPNGHREPFRLGQGRDPSPAHTSDSDETEDAKLRWEFLARKVLRRLRACILRAAVLRRARALAARRFFVDLPEEATYRICACIGR